MRLIPKGWRDFQHYKDRNPPWIRLHRTLLDNKEFNAMHPMACKVLVLLWLVAADSAEGTIDDDPDALAFRLRLPLKDVKQALEIVKREGFLLPSDAAEDEEDGRPLSQRLAERNGWGSRHISDKTKRAVWERDGGKCRACQSVDDIEFDHIHPVSKGGNSDFDNVQLLCRPCNRKKRVKTAEQLATPAQPWLDIRTSEALQSTESSTETEEIAPTVLVASAAPKRPPPAFDGKNGEAFNGKTIAQIADNFDLPEQWGLDAEALGFKPAEVLNQAERWRQYWTAGKGAGTRRSVKGWRQTWSNWLGKAAEQRR
jgi:5-methylcytosine-specific restriction endonuclease McrA